MKPLELNVEKGTKIVVDKQRSMSSQDMEWWRAQTLELERMGILRKPSPQMIERSVGGKFSDSKKTHQRSEWRD